MIERLVRWRCATFHKLGSLRNAQVECMTCRRRYRIAGIPVSPQLAQRLGKKTTARFRSC